MKKKYTPHTPPLDEPTGWTHVDNILPMGSSEDIDDYYDWLIVGAGITGVSAARRLGEIAPTDSVLLVDAQPIGWGSSGRNSGFIIDLPHKYDLESQDPKKLRKIIRLNRTAIDDLKSAVEMHSIDCDWSHAGKLQGAVRERGTGMMKSFCAALDIAGESYKMLDREDCHEIMGTNYYAGAVFTPGTVLVNPFSMIRGLASNLPKNVTLRDDTAVTEYLADKTSIKVKLNSTDGTNKRMTCKKVILAVDPFVPEFGYMKNRILPVITFASITRPLSSAELSRFTGTLDWGLTPADAAGTTVRMTKDGRLLIRNQYAHAPKFEAEESHISWARKKHREGINARYPDLTHIPFASTWGGLSGLSRNHVSYFGEMTENVYSANTYNGVGLAKGAISGRMLAELATGMKSELLDDMHAIVGMPSKIPPDPIRSIGVTSRMKLEEWKSRDEL